MNAAGSRPAHGVPPAANRPGARDTLLRLPGPASRSSRHALPSPATGPCRPAIGPARAAPGAARTSAVGDQTDPLRVFRDLRVGLPCAAAAGPRPQDSRIGRRLRRALLPPRTLDTPCCGGTATPRRNVPCVRDKNQAFAGRRRSRPPAAGQAPGRRPGRPRRLCRGSAVIQRLARLDDASSIRPTAPRQPRSRPLPGRP